MRCSSHRFLIIGCSALCAFSFLLCQITAWAQDADAAAAQHFAAAHQAQDAGNLDLAAQEYLAVIRLRPDVAEAYASLGLVYNAQGKFAESARALGKAEKLKPALPGVSLYLGIDYEKQRQAALAVPQLVEAVRLEPSNKEAHTWLARALWDDGRTEAAFEQLRQTALLFPSDPALLLDLGEAYRKAADLGIERVLSRSSGTPLLHQVYGDIYKDEHAWENSLAHYYRALDQDPHWQGAHFGLGEVAFHREKLDAAAQEYHRELEANPSSAASLARLAEIALLQGKPDEALPLFSSAIHISGISGSECSGTCRDPTRPQAKTWVKLRKRSCAPACPAWKGLRRVLPAAWPWRLSMRAWAIRMHRSRLGMTSPTTRPIRFLPMPTQRGLDNFNRQDFEKAAGDLNAWLKLHPNDWQSRLPIGPDLSQSISLYARKATRHRSGFLCRP